MNRSLARIISFLFHPLLVLSYAMVLMLAINPFAFGAQHFGDKRAMVLFFYVLATTCVIPGFGMALLKPLGLVQSWAMHHKQERIGPFIITGIFYLWLYKNFSGGVAPMLYTTFVLGATIALFLAFFANIFSKTSAHATGMGGLVAMILLLAFEWPGYAFHFGPVLLSLNAVAALSILLAGLVGVGRLSLGGHSERGIWQGYAAGFGGVMLAHAIL